MTLTFSKEEWSLIAYACRELSHKRAEQALDSKSEWREANEKEAKAYFDIVYKIDEASQKHPH